ncbi:branched-chain amino acid ABC transporter substrate-binding protein [Nocardioides sp. 503]|uniref:branched-chain amino acid ABC transporter substrate-binding protein n=1 Tax=Nocardioides sp. 503 TaxID=2508326 RepID=UPI001ADA8F30|nr:branched-chain amino acid ABC transporter substrate-binding protein [Nocardioides sp. 503]
MGALSGSNASVVLPSVNGAKLALKQWSADNDDCEISLEEFDTEGDPAKATPAATKMATDETFIGVMGGAFSGETRATKATFDDAGLTMISQSATATDLTTEEPAAVFHRVIGYDEVQGAAIGRYLRDVAGAKKVFVVDDSTTYGEPLATKVKDELGDLVVDSDKTQEGQTEFSAVVSKIESAKPDAVFYAGYAAEAGPFLKQLRDAGVTATFVGGDGLYGADFPKAAGDAAEGAIVTCPCLPADKAEGTFGADYEAEFGEAPGAYAAEGFDVMTIFLAGIKDGARDRKAMEEFVDGYTGKGLTKDYAFDDKGDVAEENVVIWSYKVTDGTLTAEQEIPKA